MFPFNQTLSLYPLSTRPVRSQAGADISAAIAAQPAIAAHLCLRISVNCFLQNSR